MTPRPNPFALALAVSLAAASAAAGQSVGGARPPSPRSILGFDVGADRRLADWSQIVGYFTTLAEASPTVRVDTLGPTTNGLPLIYVTISSPENMRKIEALRRRQARLAAVRTLSTADEAALVARQPVVVVIQCSIHSTEIGASQMAMELAYRLATIDTLQHALSDVVVLLIPSANPDGEQMITDWYRHGLATPWEGGPMPWLYHAYAGHDNNRDWFMITQQETRLITDLLYRQWFPEILYDVHQQGSYGMRLTVPPHVDPIDPNVDPLIVRGINEIGSVMSFALQSRGKSGVGDAVTYDLWWHGGARSSPTRHNMIGLLSEAASVKIATPLDIAAGQLQGHDRGLPRYERRVNFPDPWPGGRWRLRDIVEYELIASEALVKLAASQRADFVRNFVGLGRRAVQRGRAEAPYAYVLPAAQRDPAAAAQLVEVLRLGGVEVGSLTEDATLGGRRYGRGSRLVRMDQPFRAHAKDLLEIQRFPTLERYPGGPRERPYDAAGWTLPLQMGVAAVEIDQPLPPLLRSRPVTADVGSCAPGTSDAVLDAADTDCYRTAFRRLRAGRGVRLGSTTVPRMPRIALYRPWTANVDEGWTRWLFERFELPFTSVADETVKAGKLRDRFDVLVVPDMSLREARDGQPASSVPPQYAGGLGKIGLGEVRAFVEDGGTLVLLDQACEIATATLGVAVRRVTVPPLPDGDHGGEPGHAGPAGPTALPLYGPGSVLRVLVDTTERVAVGMPDTAAVYFTNSTTFEILAGSSARAIARYPGRAEDILLSGYLEGGDAIAGKAAAVEAPVGRGRVVMFGFRPQYRGQSWGTFKMLFNAVLDGAASAERH